MAQIAELVFWFALWLTIPTGLLIGSSFSRDGRQTETPTNSDIFENGTRVLPPCMALFRPVVDSADLLEIPGLQL